MDSVKRKILLDIFASPGTVLPIAGGITALLASWAVGGQSTLNFTGVVGILGGFGIFASRLILGLEKITRDAYDLVMDKQKRSQEAALEHLQNRLETDEDPRTQVCLRDLRSLYTRLNEKVQEDHIPPAAIGVIEGVDNLFHSCITQLEHAADLWETAKGLKGPAKESLLRQRDEIVEEVCEAVLHIGKTVERFHAMLFSQNRSKLTSLRQELDESMRVAREVERRTEELTRNSQDRANINE
ncbi:MAG: hypothetical protein CMJ77_04320 [Planctomycetaceae bacterium]|nr:hypothetical protein [Planctomycetaceae bacterium]